MKINFNQIKTSANANTIGTGKGTKKVSFYTFDNGDALLENQVIAECGKEVASILLRATAKGKKKAIKGLWSVKSGKNHIAVCLWLKRLYGVEGCQSSGSGNASDGNTGGYIHLLLDKKEFLKIPPNTYIDLFGSIDYSNLILATASNIADIQKIWNEKEGTKGNE